MQNIEGSTTLFNSLARSASDGDAKVRSAAAAGRAIRRRISVTMRKSRWRRAPQESPFNGEMPHAGSYYSGGGVTVAPESRLVGLPRLQAFLAYKE